MENSDKWDFFPIYNFFPNRRYSRSTHWKKPPFIFLSARAELLSAGLQPFARGVLLKISTLTKPAHPLIGLHALSYLMMWTSFVSGAGLLQKKIAPDSSFNFLHGTLRSIEYKHRLPAQLSKTLPEIIHQPPNKVTLFLPFQWRSCTYLRNGR